MISVVSSCLLFNWIDDDDFQAEGTKAEEEEESEKSMSEVNDEDDDEEGSGEVCFWDVLIFSLTCYHCYVVFLEFVC